jgi:phenylacetate-CoA ligase
VHSLIELYHRLPPTFRDVAASARGYYLRQWRYGPETDRLAAEAGERESWNAEQWAGWRKQRLDEVLRRALLRVPHYRDLWRVRDRRVSSPPPLREWPVLSKETVRSSGARFVADDCDPRKMFHEHTSGTTGKALDLWWSRGTVRAWYALFEARIRKWNGVGRETRWAMLGGQLVLPVSQSTPPYWVWNAPLRQLYMSSYHISPATVADYLGAMARYRVEYLFGYASSLDSLAQLALERGLRGPRMRVAISNAEPLFDHQRERIATVFGCPTRDTYGMAEIVCAASECGAGKMHQWPEVGMIEVLRDRSDEPAGHGEVGRIVATGLLNFDMPLIRYDTGDRGVAGDESTGCDCGRRLPLLGALEGRCDDVLVTADGRRIGRLDPVFKLGLELREAQIVQKSRLDFCVRYVPTSEFREQHLRQIEIGLRRRLGETAEIRFERMERLPRTSTGKFRAVISEVRPEEG